MDIEVDQLEWLLSVFSVVLETEREVEEVMKDMELVEKGVIEKVNEIRQELLDRMERGMEVL